MTEPSYLNMVFLQILDQMQGLIFFNDSYQVKNNLLEIQAFDCVSFKSFIVLFLNCNSDT